MSTSERGIHSSNNHYSSLEKLFSHLRKGNGIEAKVHYERQILGIRIKRTRVVKSTVEAVEIGAIFGAPGRHPRALILRPPLNWQMRKQGLSTQRIWRERMAAEANHEEAANSYPVVKITKRAA